MPINPKMDEGQILNLLQGPISMHLVPRLNAGCQLSVMAAYDRKCTRDAFQQIMEQAFSLQQQIIRQQTLELIQKITGKDDFLAQLQSNQDYVAKQGEISRKALEYSVKMITECPWEEDTIN